MNPEQAFHVILTVATSLASLVFWFWARSQDAESKAVRREIEVVQREMERRFLEAGRHTSHLATRVQGLVDLQEDLARLEERQADTQRRADELWRRLFNTTPLN